MTIAVLLILSHAHALFNTSMFIIIVSFRIYEHLKLHLIKILVLVGTKHLFSGYHSVAVDNTVRFECKKCANIYKYRRSMVRHLEYECGKERMFHCHCGKTYKRKDHLKQHVRLHHPEVSSYN